ncbi:MAG: CPBP family intramembrane metalloprotease [Dysgonamonadaceae bacterium]|jgi:membrane protease YdiL (CAAX protease family)|nr:CPBP family intramembrane metalloprotease [Dysgonamonadaceae bacterium]
MFLKAAFKDSPIVIQLLMLLAVVFFCFMACAFLSSVLFVMKVGISPEAIREVQLNINNYPELLRIMSFFQVLGIFIFPSIICAWLFSDYYKNYLHIENPIYSPAVLWAIAGSLLFVPFINFTASINQQMVFPEALKGLEKWMMEMETNNNQLITLMLTTKSPLIILFNVLVICVLTGIGEEFMFRGVLQTIFGRFFKNPHVLVWFIAIIFSAIHFQFYGFVPRLLLGAYLGYLMYFTQTIWIPVLAHFTFNLSSLAVFYIFQDSPEKSQEFDALGTGSTWWLALASLALFAFCFQQVKKAYDYE